MVSTRYDKTKNIFLYFFSELKTYHLLFLSTNVTLSTLLILAVCRMRVIHELHKTPSSQWSICSSVVEHQSAESEGLRVDSSWGLRIFSLSHARDKKKNISLDIETVIRIIIPIMERNNFPAWCEIKNRLKKNNNGSQVPLTVNIL